MQISFFQRIIKLKEMVKAFIQDRVHERSMHIKGDINFLKIFFTP